MTTTTTMVMMMMAILGHHHHHIRLLVPKWLQCRPVCTEHWPSVFLRICTRKRSVFVKSVFAWVMVMKKPAKSRDEEGVKVDNTREAVLHIASVHGTGSLFDVVFMCRVTLWRDAERRTAELRNGKQNVRKRNRENIQLQYPPRGRINCQSVFGHLCCLRRIHLSYFPRIRKLFRFPGMPLS